jgi:transposase-like protein/ribosomal protein L37AE/L43A
MEDYPHTLMEFERRFATEEACRAYLVRVRWPDGIRCPRCPEAKVWAIQRGLYECARCGHQTSVVAGTIFQGTRHSLRLWFRAMWYVTNQKSGVSALGLQRVLGLGSYRTAWTWLHKLRAVMVRPGREQLAGEVEVDEAYVGGPKPGKRGRGAAGKSLVVVAAQADGRRIGRIRMRRVPDASAHSLQGVIQAVVEPGSVVRTDGWQGYSRLMKRGYVHEVVRKEVAIGENLLPRVNRVVALFKRWLLGVHHGAISAAYLDAYLEEFTFRFNRRTSRWRGKLFYRLVQQAVAGEAGPNRRSQHSAARP